MNDSQHPLKDQALPIVSTPELYAQGNAYKDDTDFAPPCPPGAYIFVPDLKPMCTYDVTIDIVAPVLPHPSVADLTGVASKIPQSRHWAGTIQKIEGCTISDDGYVVSIRSEDDSLASRCKLISKIKRIMKARGYVLGHTLDMTTMEPLRGFPPY